MKKKKPKTEIKQYRTATGYFKDGEGVDVISLQKGFAVYHYEGESKESYQKVAFFKTREPAWQMARRILRLSVANTEYVSRENILAAAIKKRGLTQGEFAKRAQTTEMTVSRLIHGRNTDISVSLFYRLKRESRLPYKEFLEYLVRNARESKRKSFESETRHSGDGDSSGSSLAREARHH